MFRFKNRVQAGQYLAGKLTKYVNAPDVIVLGLPRGGVIVAHEIAVKLGLPLDIFMVRKLGVPGYSELAMGAIASGGIRIMNEEVMSQIRIPISAVEAVTRQEEQELEEARSGLSGKSPTA